MVTGAGKRHRPRGQPGAGGRRLRPGAGRAAPRAAGARGRSDYAAGAQGAGRGGGRRAGAVDTRAVRSGAGRIRPAGSAVQQCRHQYPRGAAGGADAGRVAIGDRRESDRRVSVHAAGLAPDEEPAPARRAHHQQRLGIGNHAAAELRALHRQQTCDHRPDQGDGARGTRPRHRLRSDRHRQRRHRHWRTYQRGHTAGRRPAGSGADHEHRPRGRGRQIHGQPAAGCQRAVAHRHGHAGCRWSGAVRTPRSRRGGAPARAYRGRRSAPGPPGSSCASPRRPPSACRR